MLAFDLKIRQAITKEKQLQSNWQRQGILGTSLAAALWRWLCSSAASLNMR